MNDQHMLRLSMKLFVPPDAEAAYEEWGANCGPHALAAILGKRLTDIRPFIEGFDTRRYMNATHLKDVLTAAKVGYTPLGPNWPKKRGLVFLQITGPWDAPGVPVSAAYKHTHAAATEVIDKIRFMYDANDPTEWTPFAWWEENVMTNHLVALTKRATGYRIRYGYEVDSC